MPQIVSSVIVTYATFFWQASSRSNGGSCFRFARLPLVAHDGFDAEPEPGEIPEPSALPARAIPLEPRSNGSSALGFLLTTDYFTTCVAASTIWQTATAWPSATRSRIGVFGPHF
jgi:hypothetical protein